MKLIKVLIILAAVTALIAQGYAWLNSDAKIEHYRTEKITRGSISDVVTANGLINPVELVDIGTQVSGQVSKLFVKRNDNVKKGQLLAEIDPSLLLSQIKQDQSSQETALSTLQQAERDLKRTRMLLEKDYVAKVDLEHAQQAYQQAKNSYDSTKIVVERDVVNLNYAKITSPIDGTIISQDVSLGQTLASSFQTPNLFKVAGDLKQMHIDVGLSESEITKIKEGMDITFTVTAYPDKQFSGKVNAVNLSPETKDGAVIYKVEVLADNKELLLLPGMTAYVNIILSEKKNVLRISPAALRFTPPVKNTKHGLSALFTGAPAPIAFQDNYENAPTPNIIYLLKHDVLTPVEVTLGVSDDSFVEISSPSIAEGDTVVIGLQPKRN